MTHPGFTCRYDLSAPPETFLMPPIPSRPNLYRRIKSSVPILVTVLLHAVVILVAGYFVTESIIGKRKSFEAAPPGDTSFKKQVEHRLQIARKSGGSSPSPVSAKRIMSTAADALQLPDMPELPQVGASSLSSMGFGAGMGAVGAGSGYNTGVGNGTGLGKGFMSLSFLGVTNQRVSKVVFVVDISSSLMDIRKGGFRAFEIMRTEISRLVGNLSPSMQFSVVFFDSDEIRLFTNELQPATVANKTTFFKWITPINSSLQLLGARSIPSTSPRWEYNPPESLKLDPDYLPSQWLNALYAALKQGPDTVFLITGNASLGAMEVKVDQAAIDRSRREHEQRIAELKRQGFDLAAVADARSKAFAHLRAEFEAINSKLIEQKKDPFVIRDIRRVLAADFQIALKKAGFSLKLDTAGWTDKQGRQIWESEMPQAEPPETRHARAALSDAIKYVSELQYGLLRTRASLDIFLFTGADEKTDDAQKNLSTLATRNGGKLTLLTTRRLEDLAQRAATDSNP